MQWLLMMLLMVLLLPICRRLRALCRSGGADHALRLYQTCAGVHGGLILLAMLGQETILFLSGQLTWANALPLHLCSLMGLIALPALLTRGALLHALFYAGLPGAMLALLFPAVLHTPWPRTTAFFFHLMHAGLVTSPLLPLSLGWRPEPRGAMQAWLLLLGAGAAAGLANLLTGGNYLFLAGPVAGTPLTILAQWGLWPYRLLLAVLAALVPAAMACLVRLLCRRSRGISP